jgi:uncharacterized membrane protein HdeD (DUF308 family)
MTTTTASTAYAGGGVEPASPRWWVLLITGIAWIVISVLVLDADLDSAATIGYLVGGFLIALGVMELVMIGMVEGWKWVHAVFGAILVLGGVAAFTEPLRTFGMLASLFGLLLVLKGTLDVVMAIVSRGDVDLWWMLLVAGVLEVLLGFWAAAYPGRSASLLVLWVGIGALIRGITQMVLAFQVRRIGPAVGR